MAKLRLSTDADNPEWWIGIVGAQLPREEEEIFEQCTLLHNKLLYGQNLTMTNASAKACKVPRCLRTFDEVLHWLRHIEGFTRETTPGCMLQLLVQRIINTWPTRPEPMA